MRGGVWLSAAAVAMGETPFSDYPHRIYMHPECNTLQERVLVRPTRSIDVQTRADLLDKAPPNYSVVFPVGAQTDSLRAENEQNPNHLLGYDSVDSYSTLADKTAAVLNFAHACAPYYKWLVKIDDDMRVNWTALDAMLDAYEALVSHPEVVLYRLPMYEKVINGIVSSNRVLFGRLWRDMEKQDNGRNGESVWQDQVYPPYPSGPMYIMSSDTAVTLFDQLLANRTIYKNEDTFIGILAKGATDGGRKVHLFDTFNQFITVNTPYHDHLVCVDNMRMQFSDPDNRVPCNCLQAVSFSSRLDDPFHKCHDVTYAEFYEYWREEWMHMFPYTL